MPVDLLDATARAAPAPGPANGPINLLHATAPPVVIPDTDVDHPDTIARYPDGTPILDRNGNPMQKPPFADLGLAIQRAQAIQNRPLWNRLGTLWSWLHQGGDMDYHRPPGHESDPIRSYRDVSNYMVGAASAAGEAPKELADLAGQIYSLFTTSASARRDQRMWDQGRSDYLSNRLSYPGVQPVDPPMVYPPPVNRTPNVAVPFSLGPP
jgi:hypothetical protein